MPSTCAIDSFDDTSHQMLFKISKLVPMPDFVKNAAPADPNDSATLPRQIFADSINRKFPCHTKVATWLSQLYFLESRHMYPTRRASEVQDRISKAAAYFAISGDVKSASDEWSKHQVTTRELGDGDYAIVTEHNGKKIRTLPISNPQDVVKAASTIVQNRKNYPFDLRHIAARKILHKASELQVQLDDHIENYLYKAAGFGTTTPERAAEKLGLRVLMMPKSASDMRTRGAKLAKAVAGMEEIPIKELVKLAQLIDRVDAEFDIRHHYDEGVETPEEIFFELTEKRASRVKDSYVQLTTGTLLPIEVIGKLPTDKIAAALGKDFLKAVTSDGSLDIDLDKFARIARTLPRNDAMLLERAIAAAGEKLEQPEFSDIVD